MRLLRPFVPTKHVNAITLVPSTLTRVVPGTDDWYESRERLGLVPRGSTQELYRLAGYSVHAHQNRSGSSRLIIAAGVAHFALPLSHPNAANITFADIEQANDSRQPHWVTDKPRLSFLSVHHHETSPHGTDIWAQENSKPHSTKPTVDWQALDLKSLPLIEKNAAHLPPGTHTWYRFNGLAW